ncbi:hypothetical protein EV1_035622 [Malus domestica]
MGQLGRQRLKSIHKLRLELLIFLVDQSKVHTDGTLAYGHEFKECSNELLQFLGPQPCCRLARQECSAHTQYPTADLQMESKKIPHHP